MEVTTLEDICYLPPSFLIQCQNPHHDATLKQHLEWQESFKSPRIHISEVTFHLGIIWGYHK